MKPAMDKMKKDLTAAKAEIEKRDSRVAQVGYCTDSVLRLTRLSWKRRNGSWRAM